MKSALKLLQASSAGSNESYKKRRHFSAFGLASMSIVGCGIGLYEHGTVKRQCMQRSSS